MAARRPFLGSCSLAAACWWLLQRVRCCACWCGGCTQARLLGALFRVRPCMASAPCMWCRLRRPIALHLHIRKPYCNVPDRASLEAPTPRPRSPLLQASFSCWPLHGSRHWCCSRCRGHPPPAWRRCWPSLRASLGRWAAVPARTRWGHVVRQLHVACFANLYDTTFYRWLRWRVPPGRVGVANSNGVGAGSLCWARQHVADHSKSAFQPCARAMRLSHARAMRKPCVSLAPPWASGVWISMFCSSFCHPAS